MDFRTIHRRKAPQLLAFLLGVLWCGTTASAQFKLGGAFGIAREISPLRLNQLVYAIPAVWFEYDGASGTIWHLELTYTRFSTKASTSLSSLDRTSIGIMRSVEISPFDIPLTISGGLGWAIWDYRLFGSRSLRGALGFLAEVAVPLRLERSNRFSLVGSYQGWNIPGTVLTEDAIALLLRIRLLGGH